MRNFLGTSSLVILLVLVFLLTAFIAGPRDGSIVLPVLVAVCWIIGLAFMFLLACSDPGIIRKQIPRFEYDADLAVVPVDSRALY